MQEPNSHDGQESSLREIRRLLQVQNELLKTISEQLRRHDENDWLLDADDILDVAVYDDSAWCLDDWEKIDSLRRPPEWFERSFGS
jgi:hypothetical protein